MSRRSQLSYVVGLVAVFAGCVDTSSGAEDASVPRDASGSDSIGNLDMTAPEDASVDVADSSVERSDARLNEPDAPFVNPESCMGGAVTYRAGNSVFRTNFDAARTTENLSERLDALSSGEDSWMVLSPDGGSALVLTERFGCDGWACLAVLPGDLSSYEVVRLGGELLRPDRYAAIANGGNRIVYPDSHDGGLGLFAIERQGDGWSTPTLLTDSSPHSFNIEPSISSDGNKVVFDCGEEIYSQSPTHICEVRTDGTDFRTVWTTTQGGAGVPGSTGVALHAPDYMPDGSIVFESSWAGEQVWRLEGSGPPEQVAPDYSNDNSPCALPNGCIVSLWLERPGSSGEHELKVMDPLGGNVEVLRPGVDVHDIGLSCSQ